MTDYYELKTGNELYAIFARSQCIKKLSDLLKTFLLTEYKEVKKQRC